MPCVVALLHGVRRTSVSTSAIRGRRTTPHRHRYGPVQIGWLGCWHDQNWYGLAPDGVTEIEQGVGVGMDVGRTRSYRSVCRHARPAIY